MQDARQIALLALDCYHRLVLCMGISTLMFLYVTRVYKVLATGLLVRLNYANLHQKQNNNSTSRHLSLRPISCLNYYASAFLASLAFLYSPPSNAEDNLKPKLEDKKEKPDSQKIDLGPSFSIIRGHDNDDNGNIDVGFQQFSARLRVPFLRRLESTTQLGFQTASLDYRDPNAQNGLSLDLKLGSDPTFFASEDLVFIIKDRIFQFLCSEVFVHGETIVPSEVTPRSLKIDFPGQDADVTDMAVKGIEHATYFDYRLDAGLGLRLKLGHFKTGIRLAYTFLHVDLRIKYSESGEKILDTFNVPDGELRKGRFDWDKHGGYAQPFFGFAYKWFAINAEGALFKVNNTTVYQIGGNISYRFDDPLTD